MMKFVVLSCLVATAFASVYAPGLAYSAYPYAYGAPYFNGAYGYGAPLAYNAAFWQPSNYRGPLSLAPGQPAEILGSDGRPLDTLDVNLDRSAHFTAKAFDSAGIHLLKKRSVVAPVVAAPIAPIATSLITPATPITYTAPVATAALAYGPTFTRYL